MADMSKQRETLKRCDLIIESLEAFKKAYLSQVQVLEKLPEEHHQKEEEQKHLRSLEDQIMTLNYSMISSSIYLSRF